MAFDIIATGNSILGVGGTIFIVIISAVIALTVLWMFKRTMKYNTDVEIIEIDRSGTVYKRDKGGIFFDNKTKNRLFWLQKNKVGLNPDKIPYIRTIGQIPAWKFWMQPRKVYLYQYGYKNFSFVNPSVSNPTLDFGIGDSDVSWGLNAYEAGKKLQLQAWYSQIMPYIPLIIVSITMMIIVIYLFKSFPAIKELIEAAGNTAKQLGDAQAQMRGSIIVGS